MVYRLAASKSALFTFSFFILLGVAGIMTEQIRFLVDNHQMDFIPGEIDLEEDIAILLAAFGVFLEHRFWLLERVYPDGVPEPIREFDIYGQRFGIYLILIAVLIECLDMAFLAMNIWGLDNSGVKYLEICLLFAGNIVAVAGILRFCFRTMRS